MKYEGSITKEILDTVKVGDRIKVNDWKKSMKVVGVSENYFVMIQNNFGKVWYSVCEKKPWNGMKYNKVIGGMSHCGKDNMVFGWLGFDYRFDDKEQIDEYLQAFEVGEISLSVRGTIPVFNLHINQNT